MLPLNITITDTAVILDGELDVATVPLLSEALEALVGISSQPLRVDLGGVTFIDLSGLRCLLSAKDLYELEHRDLVLLNPSKMLLHIAEVAELSERLGW